MIPLSLCQRQKSLPVCLLVCQPVCLAVCLSVCLSVLAFSQFMINKFRDEKSSCFNVCSLTHVCLDMSGCIYGGDKCLDYCLDRCLISYFYEWINEKINSFTESVFYWYNESITNIAFNAFLMLLNKNIQYFYDIHVQPPHPHHIYTQYSPITHLSAFDTFT